MKVLQKNSLYIILFAIVSFLLLYYGTIFFGQNKESAPQIQNGVLDLSNWDFDKSGPVKLDGPWELYWGTLLEPGQAAVPTGVFPILSYWSGSLNHTPLQAKGMATYKLHVKVKPSPSMVYGIRVVSVQMSSALYVNGLKLGNSGTPGPSRSEYSPKNKPYIAYFPLEGDTANIMIHAANYDFIQGGVASSLYFGSAKQINRIDKLFTGIGIALEVSILLLGIYHLGTYVTRKKEKGFLYFGIYCISSAISFAGLGDKPLMQIFDGFPFALIHKIQGISMHTSILALTLFIKHVCSEQVPRWLVKSVLTIYGIYSVYFILVPFRVYSYTTFVMSALQIVIYFIIIWLLSAAYMQGNYGSFSKRSLLILILAFCALLICILDASFYLLRIVPKNFLFDFCAMSFVLLISFMLASRFSEAYQTIEKMTRKLSENDRLKDEFLINTTHEFQTPLNGIINISQSLLEGAAGDVNEKQKENLSTIVAVSQRLSMLVHDILDLERIKRNEIHLQTSAVDVKVLISIIMDMFNYLISGKKVSLIQDIPDNLPPVRADENRLWQVVYNVVGNAVKFTEQGAVTVSARYLNGHVEISIEDTGMGIPPHRQQRIAESFDRADCHIPEAYGGMGLGLSISGKLVQLMGGELRLDWSEEGRGSRFLFHLPAAGPFRLQREGNTASFRLTPSAAGEAEPETTGRKFTILAVDDEPSNLQVLSVLFAGEAYRMLKTTSPREALQLLQTSGTIDLVLLDVMMPNLSGYEVCREIRRQYTLFDLPIVILTARNTPSEVAAGFEAGANDFIIKPFNSWEVRARVNTLLQLKQSVQDALASEMAFLQSQIKPHFLFNSLNAILSFCRTDSARAEQLISHLSVYLRRCFDIPGTEAFVTLESELQLVQAYVEIEKARFEERLTVVYDIDPGLLQTRLLPLTIQPLVENAIRHGIMKKENGGVVRLTVKAAAGLAHVEVWDNGVGIPGGKLAALIEKNHARETGGVGLPNIHRRLINWLGNGLQIESAEEEWTKVSFYTK
ncbi:ATP-binding protein [Paenibacillus elgii]